MYKGRLTQNNVHLEEHEYKTVKFLLEQGYDIELIPPSRIKNLRMPDLMHMGLPWEMKAPLGDSKHTIKNIVQNASQQSANIIIDLRRCKTDDNTAINKILHYFELSKRLRRIIIISKSGEMLDISK